MSENADVSKQTEESEQVQGMAAHRADRPPTDEETAAADAAAERLRSSGEADDVAAHHREMDERGAQVGGEGQID